MARRFKSERAWRFVREPSGLILSVLHRPREVPLVEFHF